MESDNKTLFGRQLRECRDFSGMSQEDLAFAIELEGGSSISHYERGSNLPTKERLDKIIYALRERGVPDNLLDKLLVYGGYLEPRFTNPLTEKVNAILEGPHKETRELLELFLDQVLDPLEMYQFALTNKNRGVFETTQTIFGRLLPDTLTPFRYNQWLRLYLLISSAEAYRLQGDLSIAVGMLTDAEKTAREFGGQGQKVLAELLLLRGKIYRRLSKWADAKSDFHDAIQSLREYEFESKLSQDAALAHGERKLAGTHLFQGQPHDAIEHIDRSLIICKELTDVNGETKGLQHRAWAIALLGRLDEALRIHKGIVKRYDTPGIDPIFIAKSVRYLGDAYRMCGIPRKALDAYDKALHHLDKFFKGKAEEKDVLVYGTIQLGKGASYRALEEFRNAERFLHQGLGTHRRMGARYYEAITLREIGKFYLSKEEDNNAEKAMLEAKQIFAKLDNEYYLAGLSEDLALLELYRGNFAKSRSYANSAFKKAEEFSYPARLISAQTTIGRINLADPDEQIPYDLYTSALQAASDIDPYLTYEVLCKVSEQPYILPSDKALKSEIFRLCSLIEDQENKLLASPFPKSSIVSYLEEVDRVRTQLNPGTNNIGEFTCGRAVIVGVGSYQKMGNLAKTTIDAQDLHDMLVRSGYAAANISLLLEDQATKSNINKAMDELSRNAESQDTVVLFFSGHGAQRVGGFEPGEYICPVEADPNNLRLTAISNDELTSAIKSLPAKQVAVFLDACHSGGVGSPKDARLGVKAGLSDATYSRLATGEGRVVIASCKPDEVSWELSGMRNGLFSHYLLKGLEGNAADIDGSVRIFNLFNYISENVQKHKPQTPIIKAETDRSFTIIPPESLDTVNRRLG